MLGSAQTRRRDVIIQHGALPLYGDVSRICAALSFESEQQRLAAGERVLQRAITLEEALGERYSRTRVIGALMRGFAETLNLSLEEGQLAEGEQARAVELRESKYATPAWSELR